MDTQYKKAYYDERPGYKLHHTEGMNAGASTTGYPHFSEDHMLFYFIHGTGTIKIEGRHYDISPGDLILTNPSELFHCTVNHPAYHERIVLHISDSFADNFSLDCRTLFAPLLDREKGTGNKIPAHTVRENGIDLLFMELLDSVQQSDPSSQLFSVCKIAELLTKLSRIPAVRESTDRVQENSLIKRILIYLNAHYTEDVSLSSISAVFNVHSSYLSHLFKDQTGMSLWNYVILRRLHHVNRLLQQNISTEEACYQAGFQNYSNFYRLYKKNIGMTPSQFKKRSGI